MKIIKKRVEKIMDIAIKEQGEWVGITEAYSPLNILPYKQIVEECEMILNLIKRGEK